MPAADRTSRARRTTSLTCAASSAILLAGTLVTWSMSTTLAWGAAFGHGASAVAVAVTLVALVAAAVVDLAAARLGRTVLVSTTAILALALGVTAVVALTDLFNGSATAILLAAAAALGVPLLADLPRAHGDATARRKGHTR